MGNQFGTTQGCRIWLNTEPCGLICGCMTWFLLFFGMFATTRAVIIPWLGWTLHGIFHVLLFNFMSLFAMFSHIKAMTTDPGAVPKEAHPLANDEQENDFQASRAESNSSGGPLHKKFCQRCKSFKPYRAHHCSICGRCIIKMDHHCPWVNNCVGLGNHKMFLLFVFWVFVVCFYSLMLVSAKYVSCMYAEEHHCFAKDHNLLVIFLMVESVLFGLFTLCMLGDQLSAISTNQTQIDRLKKTRHKYQTEVNEVCGTSTSVKCHSSWLIPRPVSFAVGPLRDTILGYRLRPDHTSDSSGAAGPAPEDCEYEMSPLMSSSGTGDADAGSSADHVLLQHHTNTNGAAAGLPRSPAAVFTGQPNEHPEFGTMWSNSKKRPQGYNPLLGDENNPEESIFGNEDTITEWLNDTTPEGAAAAAEAAASWSAAAKQRHQQQYNVVSVTGIGRNEGESAVSVTHSQRTATLSPSNHKTVNYAEIALGEEPCDGSSACTTDTADSGGSGSASAGSVVSARSQISVGGSGGTGPGSSSTKIRKRSGVL